MYYFTEALKVMTDYQKFNCEQFVDKVSQIESKQHKSDPIDVKKELFSREVDGCIKVYKEEPEKIRQYLEKKKKQLANKTRG